MSKNVRFFEGGLPAIQVGVPSKVHQQNADCPDEAPGRWPFWCTLDAGHHGPHVAHGTGDVVYAVWGDGVDDA